MTQTAGDATGTGTGSGTGTGTTTGSTSTGTSTSTSTSTSTIGAPASAADDATAARVASAAVSDSAPEAAAAAAAATATPALPHQRSAGPLGPLRLLTAWRPTPAIVQWACFAALVANIGIIVTGGAVRLTGSGLGCPTWPTCTDTSLVPTGQLGAYGVVEFTNRMLTPGVSIAVGAALVACLRQNPRRSALVKLCWWLFFGVVVQAVIGGISVRTHLAPIWVAVHMLVSMAMVAVSYVLWTRSRESSDAPPTPTVQPFLRQLGFVLTAGVAALLAAGTVVTGSGPHSGAKAGDPGSKRFPLTPANATQLHADLVFLVVGLTIALWFALKATGAAPRILVTVRDLFLVLMAQGVIGYVQYFTHLPVLLVGIHMFGAAMVWVATWRVLLAMRERTAAAA